MRKIELHISDAAFKRIRSETMVRSMANCSDVQDLLHGLCLRVVKAKEGEPVVIRLRKEMEDEKTTQSA
jgi:hypothetical protein